MKFYALLFFPKNEYHYQEKLIIAPSLLSAKQKATKFLKTQELLEWFAPELHEPSKKYPNKPLCCKWRGRWYDSVDTHRPVGGLD